MLQSMATRLESLKLRARIRMDTICTGIGADIASSLALGMPIDVGAACDLKGFCRDFLAAQPPEGYSVIQALWYQQLAAVDPCLGANNFASVL